MLPSGAASQLDPSHRSSRVSPTGLLDQPAPSGLCSEIPPGNYPPSEEVRRGYHRCAHHPRGARADPDLQPARDAQRDDLGHVPSPHRGVRGSGHRRLRPRLVLRGAGGKAFVAGTDISQFKVFDRAEDGLAYERDGAARMARLECVTQAGDRADRGLRRRRRFQHHRVLRPAHRHAGREVRRADRPHARQLPLDGDLHTLRRPARPLAAQGPDLSRAPAHGRGSAAAGYVHEIVPADQIDARVRASPTSWRSTPRSPCA